MNRFYRVLQAGGDPITVWLTQPLVYFEPPMIVVRRHWQGITQIIEESGPNTAIYMAATPVRSALSRRPRSVTIPASRTTPKMCASRSTKITSMPC